MAPEAQAIYQQKIADIRSAGRFPSLLDYAVAMRDAKAAASANDNELDGLLADLPFELDERPVPVVTDLDGNPVDPVPVPGLVTKCPSRTKPLKRRSVLRQRENARRIRAHSRAGTEEVVEHLAPPSPTPSTPTTKTKPKATTTITTGPTYRRGIASWEDAGELPRIIAINRAVSEIGQPFAFSLNLDPAIIQAANDNPRGFLDHVRRRVALTLKRELGRAPAMWLVVETDDDGRPHLHGGLALNDNDQPAAIERALAKAGGNWTRKGSAPADVRVQWAPDGWAVYPLKRMERTRRHLREAARLAPGARVTLYSVTDDLRTIGERIHEEVRRAIGRR